MSLKEIVSDKMLNVAHHHIWQKPDSCGSACIYIALKALGKNPPEQDIIHEKIFDPQWDGTYPQDIERFLKESGVNARLLKDQKLTDAKKLIDDNNILIALIYDDFPTVDNDPPCGHYVIIEDIDFEKKEATIIDPSNAERYYDESGLVSTEKNGFTPIKKPVYRISLKDLEERWWDYVDFETKGYGYCVAVSG